MRTESPFPWSVWEPDDMIARTLLKTHSMRLLEVCHRWKWIAESNYYAHLITLIRCLDFCELRIHQYRWSLLCDQDQLVSSRADSSFCRFETEKERRKKWNYMSYRADQWVETRKTVRLCCLVVVNEMKRKKQCDCVWWSSDRFLNTRR